MQLLKYLARLVVCIFLMGCGSDRPVDVIQETTEFVDIQAVLFSTSDGFEIVGSWFTSSHQSGKQPAVILVHMFDRDHQQWLPLIPDLVTLGYHVLAYDIRGHGQSTFKNGQ